MNPAAGGETLRDADEASAYPARLIAAMMEDPGLRDPALTWSVEAADVFSGDLVAARRTPSGRLLAMLADATGHGLAAAGSLLPALRTFYAQAQQDRPAGLLVREINGCLQGAGRTGRFVAAVVVEVDADGRRGSVWNGGMPAGLWLHDRREVAPAALRPLHPPLGILPDAEFDSSSAPLEAGAGGHLLFFSDGFLDAANATGEAFGARRAHESALAGPPADAAARLQSAVRTHLNGARAVDDMSILLIDLGRVR